MTTVGYRYATLHPHDYIASTVFDLVSLAGITGTMEPRGIFSMVVPAEVLAASLAEDGSRRSRPGAVPDYCFTVDGCRMLYDIKRISFCPSRVCPCVPRLPPVSFYRCCCFPTQRAHTLRTPKHNRFSTGCAPACPVCVPCVSWLTGYRSRVPYCGYVCCSVGRSVHSTPRRAARCARLARASLSEINFPNTPAPSGGARCATALAVREKKTGSQA